MRAFYDTEHGQFFSPLVLASIGIVREDGRELYMVSAECKRRAGGPWFVKNIWPTIEHAPKHSLAAISEAVSEFLIPVSQIVTRDGGNDRKLLEQLVGPLWFQHIDLQGNWNNKRPQDRPKLERVNKHHALADAKYHRELFYMLKGTHYPRLAA